MTDEKENIILIGFGGHAKSLADCIERQGKYKIYGYTDIELCDSKYPYLGTDEVLAKYYNNGIRNVAMGIGFLGKSNIRQEIYNKLKKLGFKFPIIIDPSAVISLSTEIGEGTLIAKNSIINAEAKIGRMCIINTGAIVEHECKIGDFSHISVGTVLCGQVTIGNSAFVGANATVIQCIKVGNSCNVGAGVIVKNNIEA